jgi:DNA-binding NarL/FixJ family response regulator
MDTAPKILILEDDRIIGRDILEIVQTLGIEAAMVHDYEKASLLIKDYRPDLLLCDINLGGELTGIDFAKNAIYDLPYLKVIYITAHSDKTTLESMSSTRPVNYLVKPFNKNQLLTTVTLAIQDILKNKNNGELEKLLRLSKQEKAILKLIAEQKSSKQSADELIISVKTVRNHRYNINKKLNLDDDKHSLIVWAIQHALSGV